MKEKFILKITTLIVFLTVLTNEYSYAQTNNGLMADEPVYKKSTVTELKGLNEYGSYPSFSWDHIPLYMHMRKSSAFNQKELKYLAGFPIITLEKTTGASTYGSSEKGAVEAASAIKAINADAKVLFYWNAAVKYSSYEANEEVNAIPGAFLKDSDGDSLLHRSIREYYDLTNAAVRDWWVNVCVEMMANEELDGLFIDGSVKEINPSVLRQEIGDEKKQENLAGYDLMMHDLNEKVDSSKIKIANLIRASLPQSGLDYLHHFDGSYLEGYDGDLSHLAKSIEAIQTAARDGKIIAFTGNCGTISQTLSVDENGHLKTDPELQDRLDFLLSMFLICAEEYSYFLMHDGYNVNPGVSKLWLTRFAEYDKPLGPPQGPANQTGYIYTRKFENAAVWMDLSSRKGIINWDSDSIPFPPEPNPEPDYFDLKIVVQDADYPSYVEGALFILDSIISTSSISGEIYCKLDSGNYVFSLTKEKYFPVDTSINIFSDTVIYINMKSSSSNIKFRIKDGDNPVINADVKLNNDSLQTNYVGITVFSDRPVFENYSYTVCKEGYRTITGNLFLEKDTTLSLAMEAATAIHSFEENSFLVYPVPSDGHVIIESDLEMSEISLNDLRGQTLFHERNKGNYAILVAPMEKSLIYILKVTFKDGSTITRKIIK